MTPSIKDTPGTPPPPRGKTPGRAGSWWRCGEREVAFVPTWADLGTDQGVRGDLCGWTPPAFILMHAEWEMLVLNTRQDFSSCVKSGASAPGRSWLDPARLPGCTARASHMGKSDLAGRAGGC